ncbi:ABC transporter ATP-binding protein [Treponema sp. OMZ 787]|uniref:energy-coupling factor ABC transporter ATP-binding protein n=1 Tax=Treponema sp. OMZ 787 TaxID=2563669 RepID=UPI0020A24B90|nr:ABC transporter ATP-binding protein [Treponema sp. OMZ 787]UTC61427.1 ABC transporter ATP-binding protein [Treponema sp. OMZ 787]
MSEEIISLKNITKTFVQNSFDGVFNFKALDDVSLSVFKGELLLISGANGSGKTLLMSIIAGLVRPSSGLVEVKERCGIVFQDSGLQILGETPEEDILFGLKNIKLPKEERNKRLEEALEKTGLTDRRYYSSRSLSGGEKRRLCVAGILAMKFPVIIFDEPYANLDYDGVVQVNALIKELKAENYTILLLSHELEKCYALADRFLVLHRGKKVFDGLPDEGLNQNLKDWSIRPPLFSYTKREDLIWI